MMNSKCLEVKIASTLCVLWIQNEHLRSLSCIRNAPLLTEAYCHMQVICVYANKVRLGCISSLYSSFFEAIFSLHDIFVEERRQFCFPPLSLVLKVFVRDKDICILNLFQPFLSSQKLVVIRELTCWDQFKKRSFVSIYIFASCQFARYKDWDAILKSLVQVEVNSHPKESILRRDFNYWSVINNHAKQTITWDNATGVKSIWPMLW